MDTELELELFRGDRQVFHGRFTFGDVLRKVAWQQFGEHSRRGKLRMILSGPADTDVYPGPPEIRHLDPEHGYCRLQVIVDGRPTHQRDLRVIEVFGPVLADELKSLLPKENRWGFRLQRPQPHRLRALIFVAAGLKDLGRPTPEVIGAVDVDPGQRRHQPFTLTPVARAEDELVRPEDLGLDPKQLARLNVLMSTDIHDAFLHRMPLATTMEEGGFLLGRVTRAGEQTHLVEITDVTPAHRSGAGLIHFTFTGESFLEVARHIEERGKSEELLGWYHTHLFGVSVTMGLSAKDEDLHLRTFQRPWQIAALINIQENGRVLRFYGRDDDELREYPQWISDDSGRYRPTGAALGGG